MTTTSNVTLTEGTWTLVASGAITGLKIEPTAKQAGNRAIWAVDTTTPTLVHGHLLEAGESELMDLEGGENLYAQAFTSSCILVVSS